MTIKKIYQFAALISIGLLLTAGSCGKGENQGSEQTDPNALTEADLKRIQENVDAGMMGEATTFPAVFAGEGRSNIFEAYDMRFQLEYEDPLSPFLNSQLGWYKEGTSDENTGIFIVYYPSGYGEPSLTIPYIQVQYVNKNLPNCGNVDSIYMYFDKYFIEMQNADLLLDHEVLQTRSDLVAIRRTYQTHDTETTETVNGRAGKLMDYAYIDYSDTYIIGFALTTFNSVERERFEPLFVNIVKSFHY